MKLYYLVLGLMVPMSMLYGQSSAPMSFGSAEERIVYNKQNGLNRYENVNIEYSYQIIDPLKTNIQQLNTIAEKYFTNVLDIELFEIDSKYYVTFVTKGALSNNDGAGLIRDELYRTLQFYKRTYQLR